MKSLLEKQITGKEPLSAWTELAKSHLKMSLIIKGFKVAVAPTLQLENPAVGKYDPFNPSTRSIPKGFKKTPEGAAFQADTVFEKDVAIPLRDGVKIYVDIFRPTTDEKVPAILMWSPYGKSGNGKFAYH
jgi:predicted acyl esterase